MTVRRHLLDVSQPTPPPAGSLESLVPFVIADASKYDALPGMQGGEGVLAPGPRGGRGGEQLSLLELAERPAVDIDFLIPVSSDGTLRVYIRHDDEGQGAQGLFIHGFRPDSEAEKQGLIRPGDEILSINNTYVKGLFLEDLVAAMQKGPGGQGEEKKGEGGVREVPIRVRRYLLEQDDELLKELIAFEMEARKKALADALEAELRAEALEEEAEERAEREAYEREQKARRLELNKRAEEQKKIRCGRVCVLSQVLFCVFLLPPSAFLYLPIHTKTHLDIQQFCHEKNTYTPPEMPSCSQMQRSESVSWQVRPTPCSHPNQCFDRQPLCPTTITTSRSLKAKTERCAYTSSTIANRACSYTASKKTAWRKSKASLESPMSSWKSRASVFLICKRL